MAKQPPHPRPNPPVPPGKPPAQPRRGWMATHGRDLRFLIVFGLLMLLYFAASTTAVMKEQFYPWYLRVSAQVCGAALHVAGYDDMSVRGNALWSPRGAVSVERGCDAMDPCALFVSAVLASPVALSSKLPAALLGALLLMVINLVRIVTLFLTAVHWKAAFDVMHLDVWQSLFIFLAILFWAVWASWERYRRLRVRHAGVP